MNDADIGEAQWVGSSAHEVALDVDVLRRGTNTLTLENLASHSVVMLNGFTVTHGRDVGDAILIDTTDAAPRWALAPEPGRRYFVASETLHPEIQAVPKTVLARGRADYLVIAPAAYLDVVKPLLVHRRRQGLRAKAIAIERIYDELGHGERRPEAIRDFLAYVFREWKRPAPRYVVLLGDGSFDFLDVFETGKQNHVPPLIVRTPYLWTASDPTLAAAHGDDPLPDLALGRLPASSLEEARVMIEKILRYENASFDGEAPLLLATDDADGAGDFPAEARELAAGLLAGRDVRMLDLSALGAAAMRNEIVGALDGGAATLSYLGHGAIHLWADENVFDADDVGVLSPQSRQPILLTMNCLNGYFHFPFFDSLAETLLKAEGRGAIAAISPSGLSLHRDAKILHRAILRELLSGRHERLGDAWLQALSEAPSSDLVTIYHLFGDPALRLRN